ncbi:MULTISPECIES: DUF5129 domain-containing protein [Citricoccus]|uniref:DUF5129 domain-containing protein n=1 Tax=Citricoccus TaxID=169133 RepID=UPI000255F24B|nr:DUF5129 domain-containing protein [Citricoccus sp. CH26A]
MTNPRPGRRPIAVAPLLGPLLLALGLIAAAPAALLVTAAPVHAVPVQELILADEAGVIHEPTLRAGVEGVSFHEPTTVVVLTERGTADSDFNERVLAYARENHPEWISPDGQKWADGLFLFAVDPDGRHVGTYFGEDRKVSTSVQEDIQEDTKDLLADAQWTDAAVQGVRSAAAVMNRPWYRSPALWISGAAAVAAGGGAAIAAAAVRRSRRRTTRELLGRGRAAFASVSMDLQATELNARTVPTGSRYGAMVLERYRTFHDRYVHAAAENDRLAGIEDRRLHRREHRDAVEEFTRTAEALDALDDTVVDSNTFLNLQHGWPDAWDRQTAPLREDLAEIDRLDGPDNPDGPPPAATAPLRSFRVEAEQELQRLGASLAEGAVTPDDALDALAALRSRLTDLLQDAATSGIAAAAASDAERTLMAQALEAERERSPKRPGSILDTVHQPGWFWTAVAFQHGYRTGVDQVTHAREQAAQSSASTGYGASGGSFSGAGSSSRF